MKDHTIESLTLNLGDEVKWWNNVSGGFRCSTKIGRVTPHFAIVTLPPPDPSMPDIVVKVPRKCRAVWPDDTALFMVKGRSFVFVKEVQPPVLPNPYLKP